MRIRFAVPWLNSDGQSLLISLVSSLVVVFGVFALLKINTISGKRAPQELVTGSIQRSPPVRRSASNDPMTAFLVTPSVWRNGGNEANDSWRFLAHTIAQTAAEQAMSSGVK